MGFFVIFLKFFAFFTFIIFVKFSYLTTYDKCRLYKLIEFILDDLKISQFSIRMARRQTNNRSRLVSVS